MASDVEFDLDFLFDDDNPDTPAKEPPAEPDPPANEVKIFTGLDEEVRRDSEVILCDAIAAIDRAIHRLQRTRETLVGLNETMVDAGTDIVQDPGTSETMGESDATPEPTAAAEASPAIDDTALSADVLKNSSIRGLGKGKLTTLCQEFETIGTLRQAIINARSDGKPDHANMPDGIGSTIVEGIVELLRIE